jgi:hypothetical protein
MKRALLRSGLVLLAGMAVGACAPEVGSDAWCEQLADQPAGDWSVNQAADFAAHCLVKRAQQEGDSR